MSMTELQKQTNANIQAKANLIWEIATHLVGLFKPHEYGKVESSHESCLQSDSTLSIAEKMFSSHSSVQGNSSRPRPSI